MWTPEYLNALQILKLQGKEQRRVVDVCRHGRHDWGGRRRQARGRLAVQSADDQVCAIHAAERPFIRVADTGHRVGEVCDVLDSSFLQRIRGDRRDTKGNVLSGFLAVRGRHDDFGDAAPISHIHRGVRDAGQGRGIRAGARSALRGYRTGIQSRRDGGCHRATFGCHRRSISHAQVAGPTCEETLVSAPGTVTSMEIVPRTFNRFLATQSPGLLSRRVSEAHELKRLDCLSRTRHLLR